MRQTALCWENDAHGRRLTETAKDIRKRSQKLLDSAPPLISADVVVEQHLARATAGYGEPIPIPALNAVAVQLIAKVYGGSRKAMIEDYRSKSISPPPGWRLEDHLGSMSDDAVIDLVRDCPEWAETPIIAARITDKRRAARNPQPSEAKTLARRFLQRLESPTDSRHRPPAYDDRALAYAVRLYEQAAIDVKAAYDGLRREFPEDTLLQIGRRLHDVLETPTKRRLSDDAVKDYLADLSIVVRDRDGKRDVTIDDDGWLRARALTIVSKRMGAPKPRVSAALWRVSAPTG
jgi:hypothetical protein